MVRTITTCPRRYLEPAADHLLATVGWPRRALFLDRDGVINVNHGYVHQAEHTDWLPGIFELCRGALALGYLSVVATNQAGIARGYYDERAVPQGATRRCRQENTVKKMTWHGKVLANFKVIAGDTGLTETIVAAAHLCTDVLRGGGRLLFVGGGSAADIQHWACELVSRFYCDRPGLNAIARPQIPAS